MLHLLDGVTCVDIHHDQRADGLALDLVELATHAHHDGMELVVQLVIVVAQPLLALLERLDDLLDAPSQGLALTGLLH